MIKILGISGSLRAGSSNNIVMKIVAGIMPENVEFTIYEGLGSLPHFNDPEIIPPEVEDFRHLLKEANGVFICTPEYAFGVPGSLKNALDWTVGAGDFDRKPVALVTASSVGDKGHASLLQTLTAISADIVEGGTLLISFIRSKLNQKGEMIDPVTSEALRSVVDALIKRVEWCLSATGD
ncbi:MAG: NAD(P)H-dependent oxidoreductase [Bacteroidota bacterium]|nr:NAD(P)H-dependent oxidoreductase [Bacteroidota bacterium]